MLSRLRVTPELRRTWLVALALMVALFGVRWALAKPAVPLFESPVPVSVRGEISHEAQELARRYVYTESFELDEGSAVEFDASRTPADGILAVEVDLVPETGPATRGAAVFLSQRMSVQGLRGEPAREEAIRGAEPGRYRLRISGSWVPQPGEQRTPVATLRSSTQRGTAAGFGWAVLLLLLPALIASARSWRHRRAHREAAA